MKQFNRMLGLCAIPTCGKKPSAPDLSGGWNWGEFS